MCDTAHTSNLCARDIFALVQVTAATDRAELTRDMFAFASHMMRTANVGTFQAIADLDLSFTQIKALCALEADAAERSVGELADRLGVSLGAMSRAGWSITRIRLAVDETYGR